MRDGRILLIVVLVIAALSGCLAGNQKDDQSPKVSVTVDNDDIHPPTFHTVYVKVIGSNGTTLLNNTERVAPGGFSTLGSTSSRYRPRAPLKIRLVSDVRNYTYRWQLSKCRNPVIQYEITEKVTANVTQTCGKDRNLAISNTNYQRIQSETAAH